LEQESVMDNKSKEIADRIYNAFSQSVQGNGDYNAARNIAGEIITKALSQARNDALEEAIEVYERLYQLPSGQFHKTIRALKDKQNGQ